MTTVPALSRERGIPQRTIRKALKRLKILKEGRDYHLADAQVADVLAEIKGGPGRPRKGGVNG